MISQQSFRSVLWGEGTWSKFSQVTQVHSYLSSKTRGLWCHLNTPHLLLRINPNLPLMVAMEMYASATSLKVVHTTSNVTTTDVGTFIPANLVWCRQRCDNIFTFPRCLLQWPSEVAVLVLRISFYTEVGKSASLKCMVSHGWHALVKTTTKH